MPSYNGLVASLTYNGSTVSQTLGATASAYVNAVDALPHKYVKTGIFAVNAKDGVSGGFGCQIVGGVGGATFVIAGITGIAAVGSSPMGTTALALFGIPRPAYVKFEPIAGVAGFTASVYLTGDY
jgi:hypothetical protein